jgi:Na+/H+-dicarboxylate symporter
MIVCAMILAVQSLREIAEGGKILGRWTVGYYVLTTIFAIAFSIVMTSQVWAPLMQVADVAKPEESTTQYETGAKQEPYQMVQTLFYTLVPQNIFKSLADMELLHILIVSVVLGYLIKPGNSSILRAVKEVNAMISVVIMFLIKLAPFGVFFLILPNMFRLNVQEVGTNLGILIGGSVSSMLIHLWILLPIIYFCFVRKNPYPVWYKSSKAWITAWGTASSAATLPLTLRVCRERGNPNTIVDFAVPLGCLINMDGTSIYFPMVVVFLAETSGKSLNATEYILLLLLSTLCAIGTTPIPSSSLVLTVMIATTLGIDNEGMFGVVMAIDWFIDRFRTMVNVSGDIFACGILTKMTGIVDPEILSEDELEQVHTQPVRHNDERV